MRLGAETRGNLWPRSERRSRRREVGGQDPYSGASKTSLLILVESRCLASDAWRLGDSTFVLVPAVGGLTCRVIPTLARWVCESR